MTPFDDDDAEFEDVGPELSATSIENLSQDQIDENAHNQQVATYAEYQRIVLPEGATRADAILEMSKNIPENQYGLPAFFYRSDLLPFDLSTLKQEDADACVVDLNYDEGYPTYKGAHIFWQQLPHEPLEDYLLFARYIDQAEEMGLRQLHMLAHNNNVPMIRVQTLYHEYYWKARARAHDLFQVAADRKLRELRSRRLEDKHFRQAEDLMRTLNNKIEDSGEDIFANLSGKELLECMRLLINIQRVSNGLPQNGNAGFTPTNPDAAMDGKALMEDITKNAAGGQDGLGLGGGLLELLKDPKFAIQAQSIVLQVRQAGDTNAAQQVEVRPDMEGGS